MLCFSSPSHIQPLLPPSVPDTPGATSPANLLNKNSTCAIIQLTPALPVATGALLRLPKGSKYNALAGPAREDQDVKVFGLRLFRIPFKQDWTVIQGPDDTVYDGAG